MAPDPPPIGHTVAVQVGRFVVPPTPSEGAGLTPAGALSLSTRRPPTMSNATELTVTQPTFHAAEGWHWLRLEDGSVRIEHRIDLEGNADAAITLDPSSWSSVVAFVSARGETAQTFHEAAAFHAGRVDDTAARLEDALAKVAELERDLDLAQEAGLEAVARAMED